MRFSKMRVLRFSMFIMALAFLLHGSMSVQAAQGNTICDGVYIDSVNVSNMTEEEARQAVEEYVENLKEKEIAVVMDEEVAITNLGQLGYNYKENTYIEDAVNIGKTGNLIKRYKELKDVKNGGLYYKLEFDLDTNAVREFIQNQCSIYDVPAKNASVSRSGGQFVYTEEVVGRKLDVEATLRTIEKAIKDDWNQLDVVVDATIEEDVPLYDIETVKKCNALLGSFTTNYATSSKERKNNISNAARLMNNSVVYPGEIFSCYEKMQPFTASNGYYSAHAYVNGMVEDSIGGGVCQVSTTLYSALLRSELSIVERAAHSMTVSYVPVAFDAAIAGTYKDLKFSNNLQVPVLVEAIANGTTITFNIYGCETRDTANRKIEFKSEVLSKTEPPKDVIKEDPTQPTTYRKVTQSAYTGYVAVLYKYVYENGVLVDTIQINKSTYKASPNYITVGTKVVEETPDEDEKENDNQMVDQESPEENVEAGKPNKPNKPSKPDSSTNQDDSSKEESSTNDGEDQDTSESDEEEDASEDNIEE